MMKRETQLWLDRADYDLETAEAMLRSGRYLYVAFMCQQSVEKYLKAIIQEKTGEHPPYIHNLVALAQAAEAAIDDGQTELLILLSQHYLNARYVDFKQKLFQEIDEGKAAACLQKTRELIGCLKKGSKI